MQSSEQKKGKKRPRDEDGTAQGLDYQNFLEVTAVLEEYDDDGNPEQDDNGSQSSSDDSSIHQQSDDESNDEQEMEREEGYDVQQNDGPFNADEELGDHQPGDTEMDLSGVALNNASYSTCLVKGHNFRLVSQNEKIVHGNHNEGEFDCWWDTKPFFGKIYQIPCQKNDKRRILHTFGCFCDWSCAVSWNQHDSTNSRQKPIRKTWIMEMAGCSSILHAPSPVILISKGGTFTIEQFRALTKLGIDSRVIFPTDTQQYRFVNQQPLLAFTFPTDASETENSSLRPIVDKILQMTNPLDLNGSKFDVPISQSVIDRISEHQKNVQHGKEDAQSKNEAEDMAELQNNIAQAAYGAVMAKNRGRGSRGGRARPKPKRGLPPNHGVGGGLLSHQEDIVTDST